MVTNIFVILFFLASVLIMVLVFIYPILAVNSYYNGLTSFKGLDGTIYLKNSYPEDFNAIQWINKNIKGTPVIAEAVGDAYTDYARISANTGLLNIINWPAHEWLWRGTYDVAAPRVEDIELLYETQDKEKAEEIIGKYNIDFVYVGGMERSKYPAIDEEKFEDLGKVVFENGETKIYKINR